jgi:hypothetical protein
MPISINAKQETTNSILHRININKVTEPQKLHARTLTLINDRNAARKAETGMHLPVVDASAAYASLSMKFKLAIKLTKLNSSQTADQCR